MKDPFGKITGVKILKNEQLSKHTSFHIGGTAKYFIKVYSLKALKEVLYITKKRQMRYFIIGAGTNVLVVDRGFSGVVIQLNGFFKKIKKTGDFFSCGGGMLIDTFLMKTSALGYGGAEFLAGIPGTIGGGIKGNAGAFGRSFADITEKVTIINSSLREEDLNNSAVGFGYRSSKLKNGTIIISAKMGLTKRRRRDIVNLIKRNLKHRSERQPIGYSAGSFFRNPPHSPAGKLIEACGLKGLRVGDAEVSRKHGNYIVNRGKAKASDVLRLVNLIKRTVKAKKGVVLETEVKILK